MPIGLKNLIQSTDSQSPDQSSASMRDQRETIHFDIQDPTTGKPYKPSIDELNQLESLILGYVKDDTQNLPVLPSELTAGRATGGLGRRLPLAHPIRSSFYASSRPILEGTGVPTRAPGGGNNQTQLNPIALDVQILYPEYRISVDFTPRLYNVWPDSYITSHDGQWYDFSDTLQTFTYVDEWMRFTEVEFKPKDDWISYTLGGQMAFRANDAGDPSNVDGAQYAQMPRIRMPNASLKITWYQVPYRYVTSPNSYLEKYKGKVNQNAWWRWGPGALLFINYDPKRYQQPNPNQVSAFSINPTPADNNPAPTRYPNLAWAQTCDIEMDFILTRRALQKGEGSSATHNNSVIGGHNLLPWGQDRQFHYAETLDPLNLGRKYPAWGSAPFECLFTDPD